MFQKLFSSFKKHQTIFLAPFFVFSFFFFGVHEVSAAAYTWTGGGDGVTWNSATNWGGSGYPSASADTATISSTASNITIPSGLNIAGITTGGTYSGTLTQGGTMTLGTTGLTIGAGTLTLNGSAMTLNGLFSMTGGTFNMSSSTISKGTGNWTYTAGTINPETSTVVFSSSGVSITGSHSLNNVSFTGAQKIFTLTSGTTLTALGTLSFVSTTNSSSVNTGTISAKGDILQGSAGVGGTATLLIDGVGDQTFTGGGATADLISTNINKASGTLFLGGIIGTINNWTYTAGTINPGTSTVVFGAVATVITGSHTLYNVTFSASLTAAARTISAGTTLTVNGTLTLDSLRPINTGTLEAKGDIIQSANGMSGTATLLISGTGDQTLTGGGSSALLPDVMINKPSGTLTLSGVIGTVRNWSYTTGTVNPGTSTVAFGQFATVITGSHTLYNVTFSASSVAATRTISTGTTLTVNGALTLDSLRPINTGTLEAKGNIIQSANGMSGTATLLISGTGDQTLTGGGSLALLPDVVINKPSGTLILSGVIGISGGWTYTAGTISPGASTAVFYGGTKTVTGSHTLGNITFSNNNGGTVTLAPGMVLSASGTLTINHTGANAAINTGTLEALGDVVITSSVGGTTQLHFGGAVNQIYTFTTGTALSGNVTVNKPSGTVTLSSQAVWNATGKSLILSSGTFDMAGQNLLIGSGGLSISSGAVLKNTGTSGALTLYGNAVNNGSVIMRSNNSCGSTDSVVIKSDTTVARTWTGTGTYNFQDTDLQYVSFSPSITVYSSTLSNTSGVTNGATCPSVGTYTSSVINTPNNAGFTTVSYDITVPQGETLSVDVGAGDTATPDGTWVWVNGVASGGSISSLGNHPYAQYRVTTSLAFPNSVTINYNQIFQNQYLISSPYDTSTTGVSMGTIEWNEGENLPAGAFVGFSLRVASSASGLSSASWSEPMSATSTGCSKTGTLVTCLADTSPVLLDFRSLSDIRWFQYKVILSTTGVVSPTFSDVTLRYVLNLPPEIQNVTAVQQTDGTVLIGYEVRDRDTTTGSPQNQGNITPSFEYSLDNGSHWASITGNLSSGATSTKTVNQTLDGNGESSTWTAYSGIVWTAKNSINGSSSSNAKIRVTANDGEGANYLGTLTSTAFSLDVKAPVFGATPVKVEANYSPAHVTISATDDNSMTMAVGTTTTSTSSERNGTSRRMMLNLASTHPKSKSLS